MPRAGTTNFEATQPRPVVRHLHALRAASVDGTEVLGMSIGSCAHGFAEMRSISLVTTCGLPTVGSSPAAHLLNEDRQAKACRPEPPRRRDARWAVTFSDTLPTSSRPVVLTWRCDLLDAMRCFFTVIEIAGLSP